MKAISNGDMPRKVMLLCNRLRDYETSVPEQDLWTEVFIQAVKDFYTVGRDGYLSHRDNVVKTFFEADGTFDLYQNLTGIDSKNFQEIYNVMQELSI